ncbi:hypothetical protein PISMIDRAFT_685197 [Pisolithus microcarpus 441]|uniref:Uncharacterized protein n=1 Tax=Pisolithus microcarpus 441 TaxID=765257 RepID=A0A0C9YLN7_9AGAM|nr:hypothetical protein PISMIDRAFT_685197 [Pisolithus microcarpus 441]
MKVRVHVWAAQGIRPDPIELPTDERTVASFMNERPCYAVYHVIICALVGMVPY